MFRKKEDVIEDIDSLIGENIKIIGKIEGKGNLRIDGTVDGDIDYAGNVIIGESGKVTGNIKTGNVSLAGKVNGNVNSKTRLELLTTGTLIGDVEVASFIIHEKAKFQGNCKMLDNDPVAQNPKDRSKDNK